MEEVIYLPGSGLSNNLKFVTETKRSSIRMVHKFKVFTTCKIISVPNTQFEAAKQIS